MTTRPDDSRLPDARDEGWDRTLLVWNATVARIRPSVVDPNSPEAAPGHSRVAAGPLTQSGAQERDHLHPRWTRTTAVASGRDEGADRRRPVRP